MQIEFVHSYPFEELAPRLRSLLKGAQRVEGAIAFVTQYGVNLWLEMLHAPQPPEARLVVSVRFPTDLAALCRLEPRMNGKLFIHTGYQRPREELADRGQFHSKTVLIDYDNGESCIIVGSHNWTEFALCGVNLEAGVIIRCRGDEQIVAQVRQHIEACAPRSEQFDPAQLRYYQAIQSNLHVSPASVETVEFEGFEPLHGALVIHAEDETPAGPPDLLQLFFRVQDDVPNGFVTNGRRVLLFVHPQGALSAGAAESQQAVVYDGEITMQNTVADAPVEGRAVNCHLSDLVQPRLSLQEAGNIPGPAGERFQVVARLNRIGISDVPVFHCAQQPPRMKLDVEYGDIPGDRPPPLSLTSPIAAEDSRGARRPPPKYAYTAPTHLIVKCTIRMPVAWDNNRRLERKLRSVFFASEFVKANDVPEIVIAEPNPQNMFNRFVYLAYFQLTDETISRIQRQRPLFQ